MLVGYGILISTRELQCHVTIHPTSSGWRGMNGDILMGFYGTYFSLKNTPCKLRCQYAQYHVVLLQHVSMSLATCIVTGRQSQLFFVQCLLLISLQLLPAIGVGGEGGSVREKLMESLPVIKQINEEFQDPVSKTTLHCLYSPRRCAYITNLK